MTGFHRENYPISQFLRWHRKAQLVLQPKFQRRGVWEEAARSYLMDTVVRGLPMPKVYLRKTINPKTKLMAYEVVDGQQRLQAILDFHRGTLVLQKRHNEDLGGVTFQGLPEPVQRAFLEYEISTEVMEQATDQEVWAMFERLNTYTLTLNRQEKLNAKYFGYFKQTAYKLAAETSALEAWRNLRTFTNRQIARMTEVEFTSDILVAIIRGISDITEIVQAYKDFDEEFPLREKASETFRSSLAFVGEELGVAVRNSRFRNRAWFYSLMVAVADALSGIPGGSGSKKLRQGSDLQRRMIETDHGLRQLETPAGLVDLEGARIPFGLNELREALSRGTSHAPPRKVRHEHFFAMLTMSDGEWRQRLENLSRR